MHTRATKKTRTVSLTCFLHHTTNAMPCHATVTGVGGGVRGLLEQVRPRLPQQRRQVRNIPPHIQAWINRHGYSYQWTHIHTPNPTHTSNSAGVYFNDCTKLVVDTSGRHARYIERSSSSSSKYVLTLSYPFVVCNHDVHFILPFFIPRTVILTLSKNTTTIGRPRPPQGPLGAAFSWETIPPRCSRR